MPAVIAVLLLVCGANRSLEKDQRSALSIARIIRHSWVDTLRQGETGPLTYTDLRAIAGNEVDGFRADAVSKLLLGSLVTAQVRFALWDACWKTGASGRVI